MVAAGIQEGGRRTGGQKTFDPENGRNQQKTKIRRRQQQKRKTVGALAHNLTQLAVAGLIVKTNLVAALPLTLLASVVAGLTVGAAAYFTIKFLPERFYILPLEKPEKEQYE